ncbi:hypothetical protein [Bradyrhizobium semiaridum]|uniref:hypothetical protein n=1 Tax=Bradyrhizobium semiaridum TaxID=2821404 RepID=UPI0035E06832
MCTVTEFTHRVRQTQTGTNPCLDPAIIRRIKSIGIPPAYESVWICPSPKSHIQATGLDARGRKQYRYHAKWRELRDQNKYEHIIQFAAALPALRDRVAVVGPSRIQEIGQPGRGEAQRRRSDREGLEAIGQHTSDLPQVLRAPGSSERLHVWRPREDDRSQDRAEVQAPVRQAHFRRDHGAGISPQAPLLSFAANNPASAVRCESRCRAGAIPGELRY